MPMPSSASLPVLRREPAWRPTEPRASSRSAVDDSRRRRLTALHRAGYPEPAELQGMRIAVLRETRMPALWCELGPPTWVVEHASTVASAIVDAVSAWTSAPSDDDDSPDDPSASADGSPPVD